MTTNFVIVNGKLTIGTVNNPYNGKITFTLTNGGYKYNYAGTDFGIKAFLVVSFSQ